MWHVLGRGELPAGFWWGNMRESPRGRPRHTWEDNIKVHHLDVGYAGLD
jgi:hypothetical protein